MGIDPGKLEVYKEEGINARAKIDVPLIIRISETLYSKLKSGGKLITFGNGGSAADAQHFAAELSGRFMTERRPLPAIALTTNTSSLTAIGNDYSFSEVFSRQIGGICGPNDFVVGISTSGNSANVVAGLKSAKLVGAFTLALTGKKGGKAAEIADVSVKVDSDITPIIQEVHIAVIHMICLTLDLLMQE
ncbi:MAG: SIS domain-containing protein [Thermoplasmatales archaeon]